MLKKIIIPFILILIHINLTIEVCATTLNDKQKIQQAAKDYIESQHRTNQQQMKRSLHPKLVKRTYWKKNGQEVIMETGYNAMLELAASYNKEGDKFPRHPKVEIKVLDIDQRVASVKLITDDWIDYMHLVKNEENEWKVLNVLWQYHNSARHTSKL